MDYVEYRNRIAKQINVAGYSYTGSAIFIHDGKRQGLDEWWEERTDDEKNMLILQSQAALDAMASIGMDNIIGAATEQYLSEK